MRRPRIRHGIVWGLCLLVSWLGARAGEASDEFDRQRFRSGLEHEIRFRQAAIQVAWGAEPLCDDTTEIETFLLWSTSTLKKSLSAHEKALFHQATGMDERWRIAWLDESAPDLLKPGQAVRAINGRALPGGETKFELSAVFRGTSPLTTDDLAFWEVMAKARAEAHEGKPFVVTLDDGRTVEVPTQTGCSGSVTASAFDSEPEVFLRQEGARSKIPGHALMEARDRDEFRWLAAFGTYFLASERALVKQQTSDGMGNAFMIGKVLTVALPGAGALLAAVEAQTQRSIVVDGLVGGADLFANEVVLALGGDPIAGTRLSDRLRAKGVRADVLVMSDFRRSNADLHIRQLLEIERARDAAERSGTAAQKP